MKSKVVSLITALLLVAGYVPQVLAIDNPQSKHVIISEGKSFTQEELSYFSGMPSSTLVDEETAAGSTGEIVLVVVLVALAATLTMDSQSFLDSQSSGN